MYEALAPDKCELLSMRSSRDSATRQSPHIRLPEFSKKTIRFLNLPHKLQLQIVTNALALLRHCHCRTYRAAKSRSMTTHRIRFEGANLHIETDGDPSRPTLLLWPPGNSTVRVWDHLIDELTTRFYLLRIDVRGYGESTVDHLNDAQFTFDQYARDARFVLDQLHVESTHVWSQSWGTRAAIVFCARNQTFVKSAALYAANLDLPDVAAQRQGTKDAANERELRGIVSAPPPKGFNEHRDTRAAQLTAGALRKIQLIDVIDEVTMPVLIGTGSHDPNLTSSRVIAARLDKAQLAEFEYVGHNAILEHPSLALSTFLEFHEKLS